MDVCQGLPSIKEKTALVEEQERALKVGSTYGTVLSLACPIDYDTASAKPDRSDVALARPLTEGTLADLSPSQLSQKVNIRLDHSSF